MRVLRALNFLGRSNYCDFVEVGENYERLKMNSFHLRLLKEYSGSDSKNSVRYALKAYYKKKAKENDEQEYTKFKGEIEK